MPETNTRERIAAVREWIRAVPTTLEEAAVLLEMPAPDLMATFALGELQRCPGTTAIIAGEHGATFIRRSGDELTMTVSPTLAAIFIASLIQHDPTANIAIAAPLPAINAGSKELH